MPRMTQYQGRSREYQGSFQGPSSREFQAGGQQKWRNEQELTEYFTEQLILNHPILVRGVISTASENETAQDIAEQLIDSYPMFVRGVVQSVIEGDVEEMEEAIEVSRSRRDTERERPSSRRKSSVSGTA